MEPRCDRRARSRAAPSCAAAAATAAALALPRGARALGDASKLAIGLVQHGGRLEPAPLRPAAARLGADAPHLHRDRERARAGPSRPAGAPPPPDARPRRRGAFPPFSEAERAALRRHLQYGGFLLVDSADGSDGTGFDAAVRRELAKVLPAAPLAPVPRDHVLNKSFYLLDRQGGRAAREALGRGAGARRPARRRLLAERPRRRVGARASSASGSSRARPGGEAQRETAIRLGVNIAMYALCTDYKDDAVHLPFILRRRS